MIALPRPVVRDIVLLLVLALAPALVTAWLHPKHPVWTWGKPAVAQVELAQVRQWAAPVLWVDARTSGVFTKQHVPGAVRLTESEWDELLPGVLEAWQAESRIVVYCDSQTCSASEEVAKRLKRELNLQDIFVLKGGWSAWQQGSP